MLRDHDIRKYLFDKTLKEFRKDSENNRVLNEMEVCLGRARIDVAVINGKFHGYEIKSPADTLKRLDGQVVCFNRVFDRMNLVLWDGFLDDACEKIPEWWGLIVAKENAKGGVKFSTRRKARNNPEPDAVAWLELLWATELDAFARCQGFRPKDLKGGRKAVSALVASKVPAKLVSEYVRKTIRNRSYTRTLVPKFDRG